MYCSKFATDLERVFDMTNRDYEYYRDVLISKFERELQTILTSKNSDEIDRSYEYITSVLADFVETHKEKVCEE